MPPVPVPPEVDAFLAWPNPAVVATVSPSGEPHTAATWYDWEDGRIRSTWTRAACACATCARTRPSR